eukprot:TRINITY_DN19361_c0_g1_i2.p1 TRINITY_DN19361_c0_g1~~TRINITY_DN19361_c0_g1_i2.p1  ORF type:complete len:346 (+),score=52.94 TRINITY_DN19361_c0_g1_i2:247-1284(+)
MVLVKFVLRLLLGGKKRREEEKKKDLKKSCKDVGFPNLVEYPDGLRISPQFNYLSALQYEAKPGQVFVCTYPKCGTTWVANIIYLLEHNGEPLPMNKTLMEYVPFLELLGKEVVEKLSPKYIKTHLPYQQIPHNANSKYIFMARNPKDVCVSFFCHAKGFKNIYEFEDGKFDDFFEYFMNGEVDFGDYFNHLNSWKNHVEDENVLFITYENMIKNIRKEIFRIAEFLGPKYLEKIMKNEEILEKIIYYSEIKSMQKLDQYQWIGLLTAEDREVIQNSNSNSQIIQKYSEQEESFIYRPKNQPFLRKGKNGDWKNYFSDEQSKRTDEKLYENTKGTIFENLWNDVM